MATAVERKMIIAALERLHQRCEINLVQLFAHGLGVVVTYYRDPPKPKGNAIDILTEARCAYVEFADKVHVRHDIICQ
jgi:hypothetical protein